MGVLTAGRWTALCQRIAYVIPVYLIVGACLYVRQSALIFPAPPVWPRVSPTDCGLAFEDLKIRVGKKGYVHGWWVPGRLRPGKTILVLHGNGYVLEDMVGPELTAFHDIGANLLAIDYRGYGLSTSLTPSESSLDEDARAAFDYLINQRHISRRDVFLLGMSIGSGPATQLACELPEMGGLILESPLSSVDAAAANFWLFRLYPLRVLLKTHFDNLAKIGLVKAPIIIAVGSADTLTPPSMAKILYQHSTSARTLLVIKGAGHDDVNLQGGLTLRTVLQRFMEG